MRLEGSGAEEAEGEEVGEERLIWAEAREAVGGGSKISEGSRCDLHTNGPRHLSSPTGSYSGPCALASRRCHAFCDAAGLTVQCSAARHL